MRKGKRVRDRTVAGRAASQPCGRLEAGARHQRLDALVHVAKALLQPNHGLAVGGEAEMAGLDDAGMNRTDRDLVKAVTRDRQEDIGRSGRRPTAALSERVLQIPETKIEPRSRVRQADRLKAVKVAQRALETNGRRMKRPD